jgi:hypothetical protein
MTFVTDTECLYDRSPWICFKCGIQIRSFPHTWNITDCYTSVTRWVPLLEQNLPTLPRHMTSPPFLLEFLLRNHRLFCVRFLFYFLTIVFFLISFGYCIVCISLIYGFWLQLYYHQKVFLLIYFNAHFTLGLALVLCNIIYTSLRCRQQFFSRIWGQIVTWSSSQFWEWFFSFVCSCISSLSSFWHIGW